MTIVWDISFNLLNKQWNDVKLLKVAIIGFLKSSLISVLLKSCLIHLCRNRYTSSHDYRSHRSISSSKISTYSLLIGWPAGRLSKCGVASIQAVALDRYMHSHCRLLYCCNYGWKGKEKGCDAVHEWIQVESYCAQSHNHHLAVDRLNSVLSLQGGQNENEWSQCQSSSTSSSGKDNVDKDPRFISTMESHNHILQACNGLLDTHTITSQLVFRRSYTSI
jgi:hypothetical protein